MEANKIREIDDAALKTQLGEGQEQMFRLRFQMAMGQAEGLKKYRELRKDRARMMGIMRERELDPAKAVAAPAGGAKSKGKKK